MAGRWDVIGDLYEITWTPFWLILETWAWFSSLMSVKTLETAAATFLATSSPSQRAKTLGPAPEMENPSAPLDRAARLAL